MINFIKRKLCKHISDIRTIYIHDHFYDFMMDNDDLDDLFLTFIEIKYCHDCGKIISMKHTITTDNVYNTYGSIMNCYAESSEESILEFERVTKTKANDITLYNY